MTFFEDARGDIYPVSRINCIRLKQAEPGKFQMFPYRITMTDEDTLEVAECVVRNITQSSGEVVPAQPYTFLLTFCPGDAVDPEPLVWRSVVIGFRVRGDFGSLEPLVIDGEFEGMKCKHGVLHPNGRVESASGDTYETEADWLAEQVRWAEHDAKRKSGDASC